MNLRKKIRKNKQGVAEELGRMIVIKKTKKKRKIKKLMFSPLDGASASFDDSLHLLGH
jgi:hypothetical protein